MSENTVIDLIESRRKIDAIDSQMCELLLERMKIASDVADYKLAVGKPIFDKKRETEKIEDLTGRYGEDVFSKTCSRNSVILNFNSCSLT